MNVLVISYVNGMTQSIINTVVETTSEAAMIEIVKDTCAARLSYYRAACVYDVVIIDMMVQEHMNRSHCSDGPLLVPAFQFIGWLENMPEEKRPKKIFAIFDEAETGKKGEDIITNKGYAFANYDFSSTEWQLKLIDYLNA